jgi:hypothetical protein
MVDTKKNPRHRSFGKRKTVALEPLTFDLLEGKYQFEAKPVQQGAVILDFVAASADENSAAGAAHLTDFIFQSLKDEDNRERFNEAIRSEDPEDNIDISELGDIVAWLVEEYTSRPTQES